MRRPKTGYPARPMNAALPRDASSVDQAIVDLNAEYAALHTRKEELFWTTKMGITREYDAFNDAENALQAFRQDAARLGRVRALLAEAQTDEQRTTLKGWVHFFECGVIEDPVASREAAEIVELESTIAQARGALSLGWIDPKTGEKVRASSVALALKIAGDPDERVREAAYRGLESIETFALENGFLDLVRRRNRFARRLGFVDYYDWKVSTTEGFDKKTLFALLDDLEARTREACQRRVEAVKTQHGDAALIDRLLEEATWGLDWVMKVRFPGGYRLGFGSHNFWTDNVAGTPDDRTVEAKNNPNANYISAAAEAIAARVLRTRDPVRAAQALRFAKEDWEYAIVGIEGPSTWHTPAFAAARMELAGIGVTASVELWRATGEARFREKAIELAHVITASQQVTRVGSRMPLAGFFYTGPDKDTLFHQFHRAADQAPVVALELLVEAFPDHADWMTWYATVVRYAEYQKKSATITAPYEVLPAYVYRTVDSVQVPDSGGRYLEKQAEYAEQVRAGTPMGEGWYLRTFPVWFQRRGNYGVLLSQAKALASASRLRGDRAGLELATRQAEWVVGRNPFSQSTMYGEGYDWAQQYSVSSGDMVGTLPVGMQSRGVTDLPYWPSQNMYVYKEVWVHSNNRWLWLMQDLLPRLAEPINQRLSVETLPSGDIRLGAVLPSGTTVAPPLRLDNARQRGGVTVTVVDQHDAQPMAFWTVRRTDPRAPWVAVVRLGDHRADAFGW